MNRDKQIEEMAKAMCVDGMPNGNCDLTDAPCDLECVYGYCAERLYDKGYRKQTDRFLLKENGELIPLLLKQSEGEWKKTLVYSRNYDDFYRLECNLCGYEHEPENEEQYKYCPNCGAHMRKAVRGDERID